MNRVTAVKIIDEAARIFEVDSAKLFCGKPHVEQIEAAVRYAFWVAGVQTPGRWLGDGDHTNAVRSCIVTRGMNPEYSAKVGALVWFAQTGMEEPPSASPEPKRRERGWRECP
jgi:hypothetical protein